MKVVFGSPPGPTASTLDKLLFLRRFWARLLVLLAISFAVGLASGIPTFALIVLGGVLAGFWLVAAVKLWAELRRERRRGDKPR
jgi:hypothetical protein